jgi:uncharacterized protein (DUF1330 family)
MTLVPTASQLEEIASSDAAGPVVMLNLLRFKERADGVDEGMSGADAYARYGEEAAPFLDRVGGRLLHAAAADQTVIGPEEREWDMVLLVEYPSRQAFLAMAGDPGYLEVHKHREAALEDSRLIACTQVPGLAS